MPVQTPTTKEYKEFFKQQWYNLFNKPNTGAYNRWIKIVPLLKIMPKTFIDVGVGGFGSEAWAVKKTHPNCKIIGFEPQLERFELLKKHRYPGVLFNHVISNRDEIIQAHTGHKNGKSDFRLFISPHEPEFAYKKITVKSYTLDKLQTTLGPFKNVFIWADIEGAELKMLQGAKNLFNQKKVIGLNLETRKGETRNGACTQDEICAWLKTKEMIPIFKTSEKKQDILFLSLKNS